MDEENDRRDQINIRGVRLSVWRRFRAEAVRRGATVGALLTKVLREWLERNEGREP